MKQGFKQRDELPLTICLTSKPSSLPNEAPTKTIGMKAPQGVAVPTESAVIMKYRHPYTNRVVGPKCMSSDAEKRLLSVVPCVCL
jgi:hypothetical protein